jgi:tripartite-type tricarboxylate transporter receptor subunit TctC
MGNFFRIPFALTLITLICSGPVFAYPDRSITLVNPYTAGGPADIVARSLARLIGEQLGQAVIIENKSGGGASIGTAYVARAKPDGYSLLFGTSAGHVVTPLMQKTTYDGISGFAFCSVVANQPILLVVNKKTGIENVRELIDKARAQPGKINFASAGVGGATHLAGEVFERAAKVKLTHIPYPGAAPAVNDVLGGQVDMAFLNLAAMLPFIKQGRLTPLAYAWPKRSPLLPQTPTLAEAGVSGAEMSTWFSLAAPAGTPPDIVRRISDAVRTANHDAAYEKLMVSQGVELMALTPTDATAFVKHDKATMTTLLTTIGLTSK